MPTLGPAQSGFTAAANRERTEAQTQLLTMQSMQAANELQSQAELNDLAKAAAAQGRIATVEDIPSGKSRSLADSLIHMLELGEKRGVSPIKLAPLAAKAAEIQQHEAAALSSQSAMQENQWQTAEQRGRLLAATAQAALAQPEMYDQIMMQATQQGLPTDRFPSVFDARALAAIRDTGIGALDRIKLERQKVQDAAQRVRWAAAIAASNASVKTNQAREELIKTRTHFLNKNDGAGSGASAESLKLLSASRAATMAAKERKEFPPMPIDPEDYAFEVGKSFTDRKGRKLTMTGRDDAGMPVFELAAQKPTLPYIDETDLENEEELFNYAD